MMMRNLEKTKEKKYGNYEYNDDNNEPQFRDLDDFPMDDEAGKDVENKMDSKFT